MYNLLQDFNQDTNFFFGINIFTVTKCKLTWTIDTHYSLLCGHLFFSDDMFMRVLT
jgi:hypothetical protein